MHPLAVILFNCNCFGMTLHWSTSRIGKMMRFYVFGYQTQKLRRVLFLVTSVLTCGVLPLLFYWKPQWRVWAYCIPCSLQEADTVLLRTTVRALLCCIECTSCDDQHSRADPPLFKSFPAPRYNMAELSLPSICYILF